MDHEAKNAHLGGTAVVKFDGGLLSLGGLVPSEVSHSRHTLSFDVLLLILKAELKESNKSDDLCNAGGGDGLDGSKAILD